MTFSSDFSNSSIRADISFTNVNSCKVKGHTFPENFLWMFCKFILLHCQFVLSRATVRDRLAGFPPSVSTRNKWWGYHCCEFDGCRWVCVGGLWLRFWVWFVCWMKGFRIFAHCDGSWWGWKGWWPLILRVKEDESANFPNEFNGNHENHHGTASTYLFYLNHYRLQVKRILWYHKSVRLQFTCFGCIRGRLILDLKFNLTSSEVIRHSSAYSSASLIPIFIILVCELTIWLSLLVERNHRTTEVADIRRWTNNV
jgi:hypothetical protein